MREAFHDQLDSIFSDLALVCGDVQRAVRLATQALLTGDAEKAEDVISADVGHRPGHAGGSRTTASRCSRSSSPWPATCA